MMSSLIMYTVRNKGEFEALFLALFSPLIFFVFCFYESLNPSFVFVASKKNESRLCSFSPPYKTRFLIRQGYTHDPGFQPERRPSDGESDHVDVRLSFAAARFLTTTFFFRDKARFRRLETCGDACEYFRALLTHSLSLSPILLQLYRDVQETCVKLGFLYPNAKTSDPVQRRADCVTMFRVVGCTCASTLFWCLASAFSRLFCLSLSLSRVQM